MVWAASEGAGYEDGVGCGHVECCRDGGEECGSGK